MASSTAPSDTPDEVMAWFDRAVGPVDLTDVAEALRAGAADDEPELWKADRLAAEIRPYPRNPSPWGGYFGPRFSATYENGEVVDSPPLAAIDADVLNAWRLRADGLTTPTLKAHYADLIWDLGPKALAGARREPHFARLAIDAYREASGEPSEQRFHAFMHLRRALGLAIQAKQSSDEKRIHAIIARAREHHASRAEALAASSVLNDSMESYRKAGLADDVERVRRLMQAKVREARDQMAEVSQEVRISFDEVEAFQARIVEGTVVDAFARIGAEFMLRRAQLEEQLSTIGDAAPLMAMIPQQIIGEDHVVATVGSIEDDPYGRVLRHAHFSLSMNTPWLGWALEAAIEHYQLHAGHFVAWSNRAGLFDDGALLSDGLEAWFEGDHVKAVHVLVPQIERGFRNLMGLVGRPTSKPHPKFKGAQVAVTMGDGLYGKETVAALGQHGPDLAVHLATLYADPRGPNLRNEVAHGLLARSQMEQQTVLWLVQTVVLLGLWRAPAAARTGDGPQAAAPQHQV